MSGSGSKQKKPPRGSGAALGEKVLRLSSIHSVGLIFNHGMTLVSAIVIAIFLGPADFGRYGLLLFAAGLLSFMFNLGSKQGTLKRVFGGDDDDDDDEEDDDLAESRSRALGTGLVLTALISIVGTAIALTFAGPLSGFLLHGQDDRAVLAWAALAGGFGAVIRLGSIAIWMEHRPYSYIVIDNLRSTLALAIALPLLVAGGDANAAIAAYAVASAAAAVATVVLLWPSIELCFERSEARTIMRRGARRIPLVSAMWTVGYMDLFLLSRFVEPSDLGVYHLASKAGFAVAFLPAGYRKALRPLRKMPAFHAVEEEYGAGNARGLQLGYFLIMLNGVLLAVTLFARALGRISPEGYGQAAELIPLLSAGLVAPTVYRMLSKTAKFKNKPRFFIGGAVFAALLFIGICLVLIPLLGVWAPPIAMIAAFAVPATAILAKGQRGQSPANLPVRPFVVSAGSAVLIAAAYYLLDPPGALLQIGLPILGLLLWAALLPLTGAIPAAHLRPLWGVVRGLLGRRGKRINAPAVVAELVPRWRYAARRAIAERAALPEIAAELEVPEDSVTRDLVRTLRLFAADAGMQAAEKTRRDAAIGRYLFAPWTPADRGAFGKELMKAGKVDPGDLSELETVLEELRAEPADIWPIEPLERKRGDDAEANADAGEAPAPLEPTGAAGPG